MFSRNFLAIFILILAGITIIGYILTRPTFKTPMNPEEIRIAWIGPITGNAKILGEDNYLAIELALEQYKQAKNESMPKIVFRKYDDKYRVSISRTIYEDIRTTFKPHMIFLNTYESMFALRKVISEDDIIVFNPIDNDLKLSGLENNIFLIAKRTEQLAAIVSKAMIRDELKKAAILYFNSDSFMPTVASEIRDQFTTRNRVSSLYPYDYDNYDFKSILSCPILQSLNGVVLLGYTEMEKALIYIKGCSQNIKLYSINTALALANNPELIPLIEDMRIAHFTKYDGNLTKAEAFIGAFSRMYKRKPNVDWIAFQAYDAINIFLRALTQAFKDSPEIPLYERLKSKLTGGKIYQGVSGDISINVDGTSDGIYIGSYVIKNGKPIKQ